MRKATARRPSPRRWSPGAHPPFAAGFPNLFTFLPNPTSGRRSGKTKEVGVNLKYDDILQKGDRFRGKFNVFRNDVEDYIDLVKFGPPIIFSFCPAPVPGCPPVPRVTIPVNNYSFAQYQNIGNARIEGVELEATYDAGTWFVGVAGSQHPRPRPDERRSARLDPARQDQHHARRAPARAQADRVGALDGRRGQEGERHSRTGTTTEFPISSRPPPTTWSTSISAMSRRPTSSASFAIENLLNEYYIPYLAGTPNIPGNPPGVIFPGPGITYKVGGLIRFGVL